MKQCKISDLKIAYPMKYPSPIPFPVGCITMATYKKAKDRAKDSRWRRASRESSVVWHCMDSWFIFDDVPLINRKTFIICMTTEVFAFEPWFFVRLARRQHRGEVSCLPLCTGRTGWKRCSGSKISTCAKLNQWVNLGPEDWYQWWAVGQRTWRFYSPTGTKTWRRRSRFLPLVPPQCEEKLPLSDPWRRHLLDWEVQESQNRLKVFFQVWVRFLLFVKLVFPHLFYLVPKQIVHSPATPHPSSLQLIIFKKVVLK